MHAPALYIVTDPPLAVLLPAAATNSTVTSEPAHTVA